MPKAPRGLALRLQVQTRHGTLLALNEAHLDYLAAYLGQTLRRELVSADSWRNRSQASRLPAWAKAAGNREEILKAIAKTRGKLGSESLFRFEKQRT